MQVMERGEALMPAIVRRVYDGAVQTLERRVDGRRALCVFWSEDHAQSEMEAAGCSAADGWRAVERNHEELGLVFDILPSLELVCLEPCPEDERLWGIFEPTEFITFLEASLEE